jgi:hypothetical protein
LWQTLHFLKTRLPSTGSPAAMAVPLDNMKAEAINGSSCFTICINLIPYSFVNRGSVDSMYQLDMPKACHVKATSGWDGAPARFLRMAHKCVTIFDVRQATQRTTL